MTPIPLERIRKVLGAGIPELLEREGWLLVGELQVWEKLEHPKVLETRLGWVVQGTRDDVTLAESTCSRLELPIARDEDGWRRTLNRVQNAQVEAEVRGGGARGGSAGW